MKKVENIEERMNHLHHTLNMMDKREKNILKELKDLRNEKNRVTFEEEILPVFEDCEGKIETFTSLIFIKIKFDSLSGDKISKIRKFISRCDGEKNRIDIIYEDNTRIKVSFHERKKNQDVVKLILSTNTLEKIKDVFQNKLNMVSISNTTEKIQSLESKINKTEKSVEDFKKLVKENIV